MYARTDVPSVKTIFPDGKKGWEGYLKRDKSYPKGRMNDPYGCETTSAVVRKIFGRFFEILLRRIAKGDVFIFPNKKSYISMQSIPTDEVKMLRQLGKYQDINLMKANYKIPRFVLDFGPDSRKSDAQIHVPKDIEDEAFRNAEAGTLTYVSYRKQ